MEKKTIQDITISSPFTLVLVSSHILAHSVKSVPIFKENMSDQEKTHCYYFQWDSNETMRHQHTVKVIKQNITIKPVLRWSLFVYP